MEEKTEDELVPFTRIVEELGWSPYRVRLAMGKAGNKLKEVQEPRLFKRRGRRRSLYPLAYTVRLLKGEGERGEANDPAVEAEERVPLERIVEESGWSRNSVRLYLRAARRALVVFPDPADNRKKLYPLAHTLKVLRREQARVLARRDRSRDPGAGYWLAVAELKVAAARLRDVSEALAAASRSVTAAHASLRKKPPMAAMEIRTLPDSGLALSQPLAVLVSPLRLTYWKAVAPEIPFLRGEGESPEEAVADLRHRLAAVYRELQQQTDANPQLWDLLDQIIRVQIPPHARGRHEQP
ncbi:MAG TPA: hypothetical protein VLQ45_09625 [Thermoanaerobaculia bacterium]|nr:hypothetical protein [Thermoanaerobaculia bacterium]